MPAVQAIAGNDNQRHRDFLELMSHYRAQSRTTFETYDLVSPLRPTLARRKGI